MSRTFRLRANLGQAPRATRPKTTHSAGYDYKLKKRHGPLCSFCEEVVTRRQFYDIGRGYDVPCCDSPGCQRKLRACREEAR